MQFAGLCEAQPWNEFWDEEMENRIELIFVGRSTEWFLIENDALLMVTKLGGGGGGGRKGSDGKAKKGAQGL